MAVPNSGFRFNSTRFTLVELMVSITIFTIGLLSIAKYTGDTMRATADSHAKSAAVDTASQALKYLYVAAAPNSPDGFNDQLSSLKPSNVSTCRIPICSAGAHLTAVGAP